MLSKNQIKEIQALHLKKQRDNQNLFIVEGVKSVLEVALQKPSTISKLYATTDFLFKHSKQLQQFKIDFIEISEIELQKISLQNNPNQVLAICNYFTEAEEAFDFTNNFTLYLDDIRDPGNFGTIIRLADWYGLNQIFCSPSSCDFYNPKVIQATMGAFMRVSAVYIELPKLLKTQTVSSVYGAVLNGLPIYTTTLSAGLIVVGNEANGISEANLELINKPITIPSHQTNGTESLNAAMATAIIASEFYRQLKVPN